ncbi:MAG TPA: DUF1402 family protein [Bdellovibrio sp.]|nr:DUF1402 family protein [Bdellovibrio sp.]
MLNRVAVFCTNLLFLFLLFSNSQALAQDRAQSKEYWEGRYQQLCSYDPDCEKIKHFKKWYKPTEDEPATGWGSFKAPKQELLALIRGLKKPIFEAAKLYSVDPRSIAGSILAENSMNFGLVDEVEDELVKSGIAPDGQVLGYNFTYGLGQMQCKKLALYIEPIAASIEHREQRNQREICYSIQDPVSSINYIAAYMRYSQDAYAKEGFDIRGQFTILMTLYNLGLAPKWARRARENNLQPRVNYFGLFGEMYRSSIEAALDLK